MIEQTRALKILHVVDGLGIGGAEVQLTLLLRHLPANRFTHMVCSIGARGDLADEIQSLGVEVHGLSRGGRPAPAAAITSLVGHIRRFRPGLIHTDGIFGNVCGRVAGRLCGLPVLTTVGLPQAPVSRAWASKRRASLGRRIIWALGPITGRLWTTHFMAITEAVKETVVRVYGVPEQHVSVVYRGVDLQRMMRAPESEIATLRATLAPPDAWPVLLNVGRLSNQKGQAYLIQALPRIRARYPSAVLLLAGRGSLEHSYRMLARNLGVADAVRFLGVRADVCRLLQASDLFVFPSVYEGAGVALLEAMAMGRPIVATSAPAVVEVAGDAAALVPVRDAERLAEGVIALAADPERRAHLGARARRRVQAEFDIRVNAQKFGALCARVAAGRPLVRKGAPIEEGSVS
jgi:glycosyltransferase involved in cell wall biosynthesis